MRIRASDQFADIAAIKSVDGDISTDPKQINRTFRTFYSELYKTEVSLDKNGCDRFLNQLHLPRLTRTDLTELARPILLEEVS